MGSTGSIGTQALDVVDKLGLEVSALTAHKNVKLIEQQIRKYRPRLAVMTDEASAKQLKLAVADTGVKVLYGAEGLFEAAVEEKADTVLNAIVGVAGLLPTLEAINAGKTIALANKETLVAGGKLVIEKANQKNVKILPVDSEHSAIFQCLQGSKDPQRELKKILLTASGGPFYGYNRNQLNDIKPEQALKHPNWSMGAKITIDSATLMNKGLELIEAVWLFQLPPEAVEIIIHRESILHSAVEFADNSVIAQLGVADMRIPIQYALTWPSRYESPAEELDLFKIGKLTFDKPDYETFKCLKTCFNAIKEGGLLPAAANAANEQAVELYLKREIGFNDIGDLVEEATLSQQNNKNITLENILSADKAAREFVLNAAAKINNK